MTSSSRDDPRGRAAVVTYRICVAGVLGAEWSGRAQGMAVSVHRSAPEESITELIGQLPDETALMGILDALYTHGAQLLSVDKLDSRGGIPDHARKALSRSQRLMKGL